MKPPRPLLASMLAMVLAASVAAAEPTTYRIDPGHSHVGFSIRHFFSRVHGDFKEFSGTVLYDDKNPASSSVEVEIKTASINTNNERRDNDLRSTNFFLADSFPTITFKSTKITPREGGKLEIEGNLNMHGVTKPVTLDATFLGSGSTSMGGGAGMGMRAGWNATATIVRKDWGIVWNRTLDQGGTMLGDDVALEIEVEATQGMSQGAKPGAPVKK